MKMNGCFLAPFYGDGAIIVKQSELWHKTRVWNFSKPLFLLCRTNSASRLTFSPVSFSLS